jgi:hypothetical protein
MSITDIMNAPRIGYADMEPPLRMALDYLRNPSEDVQFTIDMAIVYIAVALNDKRITLKAE